MFGVLDKPLPDQPVSGNAGIRTPTCITRDSGVHQQSSAINDNNRQPRQHRRPPPARGPTTTSNTAAILSDRRAAKETTTAPAANRYQGRINETKRPDTPTPPRQNHSSTTSPTSRTSYIESHRTYSSICSGTIHQQKPTDLRLTIGPAG
jgi:hypothetical protein